MPKTPKTPSDWQRRQEEAKANLGIPAPGKLGPDLPWISHYLLHDKTYTPVALQIAHFNYAAAKEQHYNYEITPPAESNSEALPRLAQNEESSESSESEFSAVWDWV